MSDLHKFVTCRSGSHSVEFSLMVLAFVGFLTGVAGLFTLYSIKSDLRKSITEAERYALIHNETNTELKTLVTANLATYDAQDLQISFQRASNAGVNYVKIQIVYDVDMVFGTYTITENHSFPT